MPIVFAPFALGAVAIFGWQLLRAFRDGETAIPVRFFGGDEFERGDTMFGLAVLCNTLAVCAALTVLGYGSVFGCVW